MVLLVLSFPFGIICQPLFVLPIIAMLLLVQRPVLRGFKLAKLGAGLETPGVPVDPDRSSEDAAG